MFVFFVFFCKWQIKSIILLVLQKITERKKRTCDVEIALYKNSIQHLNFNVCSKYQQNEDDM